MTPDQFAAQFSGLFAVSAFRLEVLDTYVAANEAEPYRRFLAGEGADQAWRAPWQRFVRQALAAGGRMDRVHVVREPLSDYVRFELTCAYPASVEAGEDVRILPRHIADGLDLPDFDYWLLDERQAAIMTYDEAGNWLSVSLSDDPGLVARCRTGRNLAMHHAIPLRVYSVGIGEGAS